jgi:hypothetical protein
MLFYIKVYPIFVLIVGTKIMKMSLLRDINTLVHERECKRPPTQIFLLRQGAHSKPPKYCWLSPLPFASPSGNVRLHNNRPNQP